MEELLAIKQSMNDGEGEDGEVEEEGDELSGSFGTLSIDESRTMRYLGPAASDVRWRTDYHFVAYQLTGS